MANDEKTEAFDILTCPKCGANMELASEGGRDTAVCPYCGFSRIIERGMTEEERKAHIRELAYERERARLKAEDEHRAEQEARANRGKRIAIAIVLAPIILGLLIGIFVSIFGDPTKALIDPFEDISVTFSGVDGSGSVKIAGRSGIRYSCENDGELSEGGKALITASSGDYRLKEKSREFTVTGLDRYITEAAMLDRECLDFLREHTVSALEKEFGATGDYLSSATKHYESWEWAPAGFYLAAKGAEADFVFDVIELTFKRGDAVVTKYAAYCFENAIKRSGGVAPLSFSREYFYGPTEDIGSLGDGSNPVWGSYMGVMTGYDTLEEALADIRADFADWNVFTKVGEA